MIIHGRIPAARLHFLLVGLKKCGHPAPGRGPPARARAHARGAGCERARAGEGRAILPGRGSQKRKSDALKLIYLSFRFVLISVPLCLCGFVR